MARRTKVVVIDDPKSRDHGKQFMITEMDAESAEWWAIRVLQGLLGSNSEVDMSAPLSQLARYAFVGLAKMPSEQLKPLIDEMRTCIKILLPDDKTTRDILAGEIEEIQTWLELRAEVFGVLTGFFVNGGE